jgi:hypothetical protein
MNVLAGVAIATEYGVAPAAISQDRPGRASGRPSADR